MYCNNLFKIAISTGFRSLKCCNEIKKQGLKTISIQHGFAKNPKSNAPNIVNCVNTFHSSSINFKIKKGGKTVKMEELIEPSDVSEFIDLKDFYDQMGNCLTELKEDYINTFQVGNDFTKIESIKIDIEDDEYDLKDVAIISKTKSNLISIDLTEFPEAIKPTISAFNFYDRYNLQHKGQGTVMHVQVPITTAETREKLVKDAKLRLNKTKEDIRHILTAAEKVLKQSQLTASIPVDTVNLIHRQLGIYLKHNLKESENIFKAKEKDLLLKNE